MSDIHITRELLRAVTRGELSERALAQIQARHLESLCHFCRQEIRAWQEEAGPGGHGYILQTLPAVLARYAPDFAARIREAERNLQGLPRRFRDGFVRQGIGYDAAMVSLDLARIYLRKGGRRTSRASPGRWWRSSRRRTSIAKPWPPSSSFRTPPGGRRSPPGWSASSPVPGGGAGGSRVAMAVGRPLPLRRAESSCASLQSALVPVLRLKWRLSG